LDHDYFQEGKKMDLPIATFPVAIGLKSDNHDPLEEIVGRDIKNMMNSNIDVFIGTVGNVPPEKIAFSAEMFVSLGNQPEQRSGNKLMAGNSNQNKEVATNSWPVTPGRILDGMWQATT
jgi:hypothetical protein